MQEFLFSISVSHRLIEITFFRDIEYRKLLSCWTDLLEKHIAFEFRTPLNGIQFYNIEFQFDHDANYIEGKADHTERVISVRVTDEWLKDAIAFWPTIHHEDPYERDYWYRNHQDMIPAKRNNKGSRKKGFEIQIQYFTQKYREVPYVYRSWGG